MRSAMLLRLLSLLTLSFIAAAADSATTLMNGNAGLTGSGYGDAYGGTPSNGVYGVGGRAGGQLGLTGLLGMGSGRMKRQIVNTFPMASALASVYGAHAVAGSASGAGPSRFVPFSSLFPVGPFPHPPPPTLLPPPPTEPTTTTTTTPAPTPVPTTVPTTEDPTTEEPVYEEPDYEDCEFE